MLICLPCLWPPLQALQSHAVVRNTFTIAIPVFFLLQTLLGPAHMAAYALGLTRFCMGVVVGSALGGISSAAPSFLCRKRTPRSVGVMLSSLGYSGTLQALTCFCLGVAAPGVLGGVSGAAPSFLCRKRLTLSMVVMLSSLGYSSTPVCTADAAPE